MDAWGPRTTEKNALTLARMGLVALALVVPASVSAEYYLPAGDTVH